VRVVVTRAEVGELGPRLEALGHEVVHCPLIRIEPLGDESLDLSGWDWVVVTSRNGAHEIGRRLDRPPRHFAAIGPGTAEALSAHGLAVDLVPRVHTQEGLRDELPPGRRLLAAAEGARRDVLDAAAPEGDVALLASPSAARAFAATGARMPVLAIGPQTEAEARSRGLDVEAVAPTHDLDGLVAAVESLSPRWPSSRS
jgi:uroporphyrinogen-III synthase